MAISFVQCPGSGALPNTAISFTQDNQNVDLTTYDAGNGAVSPTVGNIVIVMGSTDSLSSAPSSWSVTDNAIGGTNTWNLLAPFHFTSFVSGTQAYGLVAWSKLAFVGVGSWKPTIHLNGGLSGNLEGMSLEISGSNGLDSGTGYSSANGTSASPDPGSLTLTDTGDLVVALFGSDHIATTITPPSGWTELTNSNPSGTYQFTYDYIYKANVLSPSHPVWTNGVDGGTSVNWGAAQVAFKASAVGDASNTLYWHL